MKKIVVLVSGGVDSFISYRMAKATRREIVVPLYVDIGHNYNEKELVVLRKLIPETIVAPVDYLEAVGYQPTIENQEIYGRNFLLAFVAAHYGDEIWLSALETEMNKFAVPDKQPDFFYMASALLTKLFQNKQKETRLLTPVGKYSKSELIYMALKKGWVTKEELKQTVSCYDENSNHCGVCSTCFKRWIAFENNNIKEEYDSDIRRNPYGLKVAGNMLLEKKLNEYSGRFTMKRYEEMESYFEWFNKFKKEMFKE